MKPKAFAIDELVINDGESNEDAVWVSMIRDGLGLPRVSPLFASRQGRHPKISGIDRSEDSRLLETVWASNHAANRRQLKQFLNPDLEVTRRLLAVDYVPPLCAPDHVLLAMGPWDIYCDDSGDWHVRDLLQPDDLEADISGAVHFEDGKDIGQRAIVIESTETNDCENPRMLDGNSNGEADNWTTGEGAGVGGSPTYTVVDHDRSEFGWLQRIQYTGIAGDADDGTAYIQVYYRTAVASYGVGDDCTFSLDCKGSTSGVTVQIVLRAENAANGNLGSQTKTLTLTDSLQRAAVIYENLPATTDHVWVAFYISAIGENDEIDAYFGAVNIEDNNYGTTFIAGNLGPSYAWSGTEDDSASTRTETNVDLADIAEAISDNETFSVRLVMTMPHDHDEDWHVTTPYLFDARGASDNDRIIIFYSATAEQFRLYVNGAVRVSSSAQTFDKGDDIELVATFDFSSNSYALYLNGSADGTDTTSLDAPTAIADVRLGSQYNDSGHSEIIFSEFQVFDHILSQEDVTVLYRSGSSNALDARWLDVLCYSCDPWAPKGRPLYFGLVSSLAIHGDVRWRQRDGDVRFWRCYDADEEITVTVSTDDDVYPEFRITPRTAKTSGFQYKQWQAVKWASSNSTTNYPVMLGAFNLTGKAQGDGDDIRVYVDGEEVDRWLGGTLVSAVKVWANLDFEPNISLTLAEAIAAAGDIDYIQFDEDISDLPVEGIIYIDSEAFVYTDKNNRTKKISGITREVRGTSAAAHSASTAAYWIQHDIYVYYGDSSLGAPTVDDDYEPAFDLDNSTNSSWVYADFGEDDGLRVMQWSWDTDVQDDSSQTTANHGGTADPWEEFGIYINVPGGNVTGMGALKIYNPCGWATASFTNGEFYIYQDLSYSPKHVKLQACDDGSSWADEQTYNLPDTFGSWTAASNITDASINKDWIRLYARTTRTIGSTPDYTYIEYADVTLTVENPPVVASAAEQEAYALECTITNTTTDEAIAITASMVLDQTLVVNTDEKDVALDDGTRLATAVEPDTTRRDWLRFVGGDNDLTFEETGAQEVEIDILWDRRLFE